MAESTNIILLVLNKALDSESSGNFVINPNNGRKINSAPRKSLGKP